MSTPQQASHQTSTGKWLKTLGVMAVIIIILSIGYNIFGGKSSKKSGDAYGWELIERINCPMGRVSWDKGRGWCASQMKLEPGTYRILLREVRWDVAFWDPVANRVAEYRPMPPQGISIAEWGQSDPSFVRTWLQDAPVGSNRRFGSIVAKLDGQAFDPFQKASFEVEQAAVIAIGPNIHFCDTAFVHNRGHITVEIEKEM